MNLREEKWCEEQIKQLEEIYVTPCEAIFGLLAILKLRNENNELIQRQRGEMKGIILCCK